MEEYDVVVIGAGHNSLVAADCFRDGELSIVVVEADDRVDGMTSTSTPIPAAPHHPITKFSIDSFFCDSLPPCHDLQLHHYGRQLVEFDPGHLYLHTEGGSIASFTDPSRNGDEVRRFWSRDVLALFEFVPALQALAGLAMRVGGAKPARSDLSTLIDISRRAFGRRINFSCAFVEAVQATVARRRRRLPVV